MQTPEVEEEFLQAKICDFGYAAEVDPDSKKCYFYKKRGTIGYMAPEISNVSSKY